METLKSYIAIVDPNLLHHINGKPGEFITLFQEKNYISEEAFMVDICGTRKDKKYYQNLKSKTIKILQALAFVSVSRGASMVRKKFDICQKKFLIGQKFIAEKDQNEGVRLIRQAYLIAREYHFIHLACEMANILYKHHIYYQPDKKKAAAYATQMRSYLHDYMIDRKAEDHYLQFISNKSVAIRPEILNQTIEQINALNGRSLRYMLYKSILEVLKGFQLSDYKGVIQTSRMALDFFKGKKGVYGGHYQYLYSKTGIAYMALGQYESAEGALITASEYAPRKSYNDYLARLYKTINALHSSQYNAAYDLYRESIGKCPFEPIRQQFAIIGAYLCFLSHVGLVQSQRRFRLGKYLNETILSRSEKQGDNIAIMIAELLVYLARDRAKFIDRIEAINTYSYRHLRSPETQRAKRFIQILCMLPRVNFNHTALRQRCQKQMKYLDDTPISIGQNVTIIEILPYTTLLDMILEKLDQKVA